jgi:hypothetical protein
MRQRLAKALPQERKIWKNRIERKTHLVCRLLERIWHPNIQKSQKNGIMSLTEIYFQAKFLHTRAKRFGGSVGNVDSDGRQKYIVVLISTDALTVQASARSLVRLI